MCAFVVLGTVFPYQAKRLAWGTSPKWPVLCRVRRKNHNWINQSMLLMVAAEQRRRPSRDNSASPPPTAVQTQQPQSTQAQVTDVSSEHVETASSDAPPGDDTGVCATTSFCVFVTGVHIVRFLFECITDFGWVFSRRHYASVVYAMTRCRSICLSQAGVLPKQLNKSSCFFLEQRLPLAYPTPYYKGIWVPSVIRILL